MKQHQQFNQWLAYNSKAVDSKKHEVSLQLGELYRHCQSQEEKKAFIGRWLKNGGARGDMKALISNEIELQNSSKRQKTSGYLTPGAIATLEGLQPTFYRNIESFAAAIQGLILANLKRFPPSNGEPVEAGVDFWTSRYHYSHVGATVEEESSSSIQKIAKSNSLSVGSTTAANLVSACLAVTSEVAAPALEDGKPDAKAEKQQAKEKAALGKKTKVALKSYCNVVNALSKCRSQLLISDHDESLVKVLEKAEKQAKAVRPKEGEEMEELDLKMQGMNEILQSVHKAFPMFAPKDPAAKRSRGGREHEDKDEGVLGAGMPGKDGKEPPAGVIIKKQLPDDQQKGQETEGNQERMADPKAKAVEAVAGTAATGTEQVGQKEAGQVAVQDDVEDDDDDDVLLKPSS